jgi:hypothetical protein
LIEQQRATTAMKAEVSRKDALIGAGLSAGVLLFGAGALPGPALAEFTPTQYFRYAPRIKSACVGFVMV